MIYVKKILGNIIIVSAFAASGVFLHGCSENIIEPSLIPGASAESYNSDKTLIWHYDGISVFVNGERIVNNEAICHLNGISYNNILISFDGYTNADTTQYVSQVTVEIDNEPVLIENGSLYINRHHEICINKPVNNFIRFYIALWCDEIECSGSAKLEITNLNIYNYY